MTGYGETNFAIFSRHTNIHLLIKEFMAGIMNVDHSLLLKEHTDEEVTWSEHFLVLSRARLVFWQGNCSNQSAISCQNVCDLRFHVMRTIVTAWVISGLQ